MSLENLRKEIEVINSQVLKLLAKRNKVAMLIGEHKKKEGIPVTDEAREKEVFANIKVQSEALGLDSEFTKELFKLIVKESKRVQR